MDTALLLMAVLWLLLQVLALWKMRGGWRVAAWIPLAVMGCALAVAVLGVLAGSNIAPIWVVFTLPLALLWLVVLWAVRGVVRLFNR